jgi:hypothetical protein
MGGITGAVIGAGDGPIKWVGVTVTFIIIMVGLSGIALWFKRKK